MALLNHALQEPLVTVLGYMRQVCVQTARQDYIASNEDRPGLKGPARLAGTVKEEPLHRHPMHQYP